MDDQIRSVLARSGRGRRWIWGVLVLVLLVAGGGYAAFRFLGGGTDPEVSAAKERLEPFLGAWETGKARRAASYTDSPGDAESLLDSVMTNLDPAKTEITAGDGERKGDEVRVPFTVNMRIPGVGTYDWDSEARLRERAGKWTVMFSSPMVHPKLRPGQTLALSGKGARGKILDSKGHELQAASVTGSVDPSSGKGTSGLQARYDDRLSGGKGARKSVVVADRNSGKAVKKLTAAKRAKGKPVRTTIDPRVQKAAADALSGVKKNAALVAVDPRTGHILAAANQPGGMNRALEGRYPPGSTFKVVTSAALLEKGMRPADPGACPKFVNVEGRRLENQGQFSLPQGTKFEDDFAQSCNTFFIGSRKKLSDSTLRTTAQAFGIGGKWDVGASTFDGSVPDNTSDGDKAVSVIGQGRVEASPLVMASVAGTVKNGSFQQPVLVPDQVRKKYSAPKKLEPQTVADLRTMMRSVVTKGSGKALKNLPGGPHAKTGTAEFGTDKPPRTHAWMIGYQEDSQLAWSVLLEDGGSGGSDAGPVAAKFLKNLGK
ncbi:penicillin-binding transpeptidase domain-containing protein [Streptomyces axinellae]